MGAFDTLEAYLEHVSLVMDLDREAGEDAVQIMTLHSRQGAGVPAGVPARLGGRRVPIASAAWTRRARRASRRSGGWPTSA